MPSAIIVARGANEGAGVRVLYEGRELAPNIQDFVARLAAGISNVLGKVGLIAETAKLIEINASGWRAIHDFYRDVLAHVGAPHRHGNGINALSDSMIYGGINAVEPPDTIGFLATGGLPDDILEELRFAKQAIADARLEKKNATGIDVEIEFDIV